MQRAFVVLALLGGLITTSASAQNWRTEVGIQGGYTRIKPAGTGVADHVDVFGFPGDLFGVTPSSASLYAIFPWKSKLAIEPTLSFFQGNTVFLLGDATFVTLGLRGDYAVTRKFYVAAGGVVHWYESGGTGETQLGLQGAVGYRFPFIAGLRGRIEGNATFFGNSENLSAANAYGLSFGVSKQIGAAARARAATAQPRRATNRAWEPTFGLQGGYSRAHGVGGGDLTSLSFPGIGGTFGTLGSVAASPTLFAILPIGRKIAIEPGLDFHRIQSQGATIFSGNLSARLAYAVSGGWYGALGGNLHHLKVTGVSAETITGLNLGWGYRFPLLSGLGGRVELNYNLSRKNDNLGLPPINTFSINFGVTTPLR